MRCRGHRPVEWKERTKQGFLLQCSRPQPPIKTLFGLVTQSSFLGRIWDKDCVTNAVGGHRSPGRSKVHQGVTDEGAEIVFPTPLRKTVCPLNPGVKVFQTESAKKNKLAFRSQTECGNIFLVFLVRLCLLIPFSLELCNELLTHVTRVCSFQSLTEVADRGQHICNRQFS